MREATLTGTQAVAQVVGIDEDATPSLDVQAERLYLEAWNKHEDVEFNTIGYTSDSGPTKTKEWWHEVHITLQEMRPGVVLFLEGASEVQLEDSRMAVGGHLRDAVTESVTSEYHREPTEVAVPRLHEIGVTEGILTAVGDFTLSLFDTDILLRNDTDEKVHWSGARSGPGTLSPAINGSDSQRLYLTITNGTLRFPLTGLEVRDLYIAGTRLDAASAVLDLAGQDAPLSLAGPLRFGLGPVSDGSFPGRVMAPEREATGSLPPPVGTHSSLRPTSASAVPEEGVWTTSLLVGAIAVAAVALVAWRALRLLRLRRALDEGDYRSVAAGAGLENSRRFGPEVVVARVVCMVKTGEYAAASSLLEKRGDRLSPAVCAYLWACVHAGSGATEEARDAVIRSVLADPGMAMEVAANGSLRRFLADVGEGGYS